jgi:hypothetical protein
MNQMVSSGQGRYDHATSTAVTTAKMAAIWMSSLSVGPVVGIVLVVRRSVGGCGVGHGSRVLT